MANATKQFFSPKGELFWTNIRGEGKENMSGKMQYVSTLVLENDQHPIVQELEQFWEENKPKNFKKAPKTSGWYYYDAIKDEDGEFVLDEEGNKTFDKNGRIALQFKTGTTFPDGKNKVVGIYNAAGKPVQGITENIVGNGSIGKIKGAMGIYVNMTPNGKTIVDAGVTLYLNAIQVSKLEKYTADAGFDADEEHVGNDGWDENEWTGEGEATQDSDSAAGQVRI